MAIKSASISCFLRCGSAAGAVRPSVWARSAGFLGRDSRTDGTGSKLSCSAPTPWSYAHNFDSDSESMPPGPWWGEPLLEEDAEFFPLADFIPVGQGRKELDAIWHALVAGPLESIILTLREIMAAGNLFRCRSFHFGTLSGIKGLIFSPFTNTEYHYIVNDLLSFSLDRNSRSENCRQCLAVYRQQN